MQSNFFHSHLHSQFSVLDGMADVESIVDRIVRYGQPGLALTDHGGLPGTVKAYKAAKAADIKFFPGIESYIIDPNLDRSSLEGDEIKSAERYHLGLLGLNLKGYQGLVKLSTLSFTRPRFSRFPRLLVDDLVEWGQEYGNDIAITTGCVFGLLEKTLIDSGPESAMGILRMLQQVTPNVYVEVQKHNIPDGFNEMPEDQLIKETIDLADKAGLPLITTADCHYLDQKHASAHCVVGDTKVTAVGPGNGKTIEWYYNMLHGAINAQPGFCESCGVGITKSNSAYKLKVHTGGLQQIRSGKWLGRITLDGVRIQSPAGSRQDAETWLEEKRQIIEEKWLCKPCYHTRYVFTQNGGTKIVGRNSEGKLDLQKMVDVVYNGVQPVMTITTANGKSITSTYNHRHLTENGWKRAEQLTTEDHLITYDKPGGRYNRKFRPTQEARLAVKARAEYKCERCGLPDNGGTTHQVAHKDYSSNNTDNLLLLCQKCHREYDKATRASAWTNPVGVAPSKVASIIYHDESVPVYDVVMNSEDHSWLGNEIVTHNSMMKKVGYNNDDDSNEFPGDTFHVSSTGWLQEKWDKKTWDRFEESYTDLLDKWDVHIPELDTFHAHVPEMHPQPDAELWRICNDALKNYAPYHDNPQAYDERLAHELRVIHITQTDNYFLLVKKCVDYARSKLIPIEARGSAAGSLVCFLLDITQIDPLIWGTTFERFLSEDRVGQMPDVDIDISDVDRHIILEYLSTLEINGVKYKTSQIGTFSKLGQKKDDPNDTGSAFNKYMGYLKSTFMNRAWEEEKAAAEREERKPVKARADEKGAINWNMSAEHTMKTLSDVKKIRPKDYEGLKEIIDMNTVYQGKGTHAGGILVSGKDVKIEEFIPLMMIPGAKKDTVVTQYTMKDVEQFGLLKMDWLGQTSLTVMRKCQEFMGRKNPLDFSWIPFDDAAVMKYVSVRKNHPGLFHLEQFPKSIAMNELKPTSTADFVIWQAYSMPGAVDSGAKDIYLERRKSKSTKYPYEHPLLKETFGLTNGVMLFQEQVLDTCRGIGMPGEELTSFFKIIKDSGAGASERNQKRLAEARPRFGQLAEDAGLTEAETAWVWKQMVAMGGYAFNKAHAASYGIRSYRTAYLKYYHPTEYMAALLYCWATSNAKTGHFDKVTRKKTQVSWEKVYLDEAERLKLPILSARINESDWNWKVEGKALRTGYVSVKGIGESQAKKIAANQPYRDILDFAERSGVSGCPNYLEVLQKTGEPPKPEEFKGVLAKLYEIGAFYQI